MTAAREQHGSSRLVLFGALAAAAIAWIVVAIASFIRSPDIGGFVGGVLGGFFVALLIAGAGAWWVLGLFKASKPAREGPAPRMTGTLQEALDALERIRQDTQARIAARAAWCVPLGVLAAAAIWVVSQFSDDPPDLFGLVVYIGFGGLAGYFWAAHKLSEAYRRLYKEKVLPQLAAQFGGLSYRRAAPEMGKLRQHRLFETFDAWTAEDEILGEHRGLPVSLVELHLTCGRGKRRRTIFNGLLVTVTLPRGLSGLTVVTSDRGLVGNLLKRLGGRYERVRVEDPGFEQAYEVYGTDQIAARALLTPAFMERFMQLARSGQFGAPMALVDGNDLLIALPTRSGHNLFEPPSYRQPAAGREALYALTADIDRVLKAADAVIDLDYAARSRAAEASPSEPAP